MRILVTGATGFLGSHLTARLLSHGHIVHAFTHAAKVEPEGCRVFQGDVRDGQVAKRAAEGCEAVVHLAGKAHAVDERRGESALYDAVNVEGTRHVLDAAVASGARTFILASTVKVFGEATAGCIDESSHPAPQSAYAKSKWAAEQVLRQYAAAYGIRAISLRLPLVYGPTQKGNLFRMIQAIDQGRFPPLPRLPHLRSMLHVNNCTDAILRLLGCGRPLKECYIVADAKPYSVTAVYEMLCAGLGKPIPRWRVPLPLLKCAAGVGSTVEALTGVRVPLTMTTLGKLIDPALYSSEALFRDLDYRPTLSFADAVPEMIGYYRRTTS